MTTSHRIAGLVLLGAALWAADESYDSQRKNLRETLKARTLEASAIAPFEALLKSAANDDQKGEALTMLADALGKAALHERAAAQWGAYADLQRVQLQVPAKDRAPRIWNGEINRLRALERVNPLPGAALRAAAQAALEWTDPPLTVPQQLELCNYAAKGLVAEKGAATAVDWLTGKAAKASDEGGYRIELLILLANIQQQGNLDAQPTYARILADAQAKPEQRGQALLQQANALDRARKAQDALAAAVKMVPEFTQAAQAGWAPSWSALNGLRWGAGLARRLGEYAQAETFITCLGAITKDAGWQLGAQQELAALRLAQGRFADAEKLYTELTTAKDARIANEAQLSRAFVVYRDLKDAARGLPLVEAALGNEQIPFQTRAGAVNTEARRLLTLGDREGALAWYARIEKLPGGGKDLPKAVSQALVEMGQIAESRSDKAGAKAFYQRALDLADGDTGARVRARNALADIRYFE